MKLDLRGKRKNSGKDYLLALALKLGQILWIFIKTYFRKWDKSLVEGRR